MKSEFHFFERTINKKLRKIIDEYNSLELEEAIKKIEYLLKNKFIKSNKELISIYVCLVSKL